MAILSIETTQTGQVSVLPSYASINTNDTEATVLTTGYLNREVANGASFNLPCIAKVSTQATPTSPQTVGWYNVAHVAPNWSLTSVTSPGEVVLPTIANHFIASLDVNGTLGNYTGTIIQNGNIQAGTTTVAGALISTPGTANGTLQLKAVTSAGNYNAIISNASLAAQSSTFTLADPVSATSNILQAPAALVNGNFPKNSGTVGLVVDSGIAVAELMQLNAVNTLSGSGQIILVKADGTEASNAVTASGNAGIITTSSLTVTSGSTYAITWTNTKITATSVIMLSVMGGSNTEQNISFTVTAGTGTSTLTIYNNAPVTSVSGTILIGYVVL